MLYITIATMESKPPQPQIEFLEQQRHLVDEAILQAIEAEPAPNPSGEWTREERNNVIDHVSGKLYGTLNLFGGKVESLRGKKILSLACGYRGIIENPSSRWPNYKYEPWFCRILKRLGADPVGIDIEKQKQENFTSYQRDLSILGAIDEETFPDHFFDGVDLQLLTTSPKFEDHLISKGRFTTSEMNKMFQEIARQIKRVLKPDGKVIFVEGRIREYF